MARYLTLQNIRRIYSVFFLALFVILLAVTDFRRMKGYEVSLFLEIDPLVGITSFLTSYTVYRGLILSLLIIVPTIFLGRFFCSWICPFGILNHWISHVFNRKKMVEHYKGNSYRPVYRLKYYILTAVIIISASGSLQTGLLDPISLMSRSFTISVFPASHKFGSVLYLRQPVFYGGILISFIFLAILLANRFIPRFWCRTLCPLGALLGLLSMGSIARIRRDVEKCTDCGKCQQFCQGACEPQSMLRITECHVCMNCIEQCPEKALSYGLPRSDSSVQRGFDISRRRLIETGITSLLLFPMMKTSVTGESTAQDLVIRPPGSLGEKDFLNRCIKCSECMKVCPTNVLQPALLEAGLEGIWTPFFVNKIGYCEHNCVLCGKVCPTGAIRSISLEEKLGKKPHLKPLKIGTAFYDRGRCLPWAMDKECIVCEEVCPTSPKAIWFRKEEVTTRDGHKKALKRPYLDPEKCIGCGICENKCPVIDKPAIRVTSVGESRSRHNQMMLKTVIVGNKPDGMN